jgi:hypothetical protein
MPTKVLQSRQEFEDAVRLVLTISTSTGSADIEIASNQCAIFDFSDKDCPYKQNQTAFDRYTAERGVPAFRIDPTLAGVSPIDSCPIPRLINKGSRRAKSRVLPGVYPR